MATIYLFGFSAKEKIMKTKRIVQLEITCCGDCPYREDTDGIEGDATWCNHKENGTTGTTKTGAHQWRQITGDDYNADFPIWCPLTKLS